MKKLFTILTLIYIAVCTAHGQLTVQPAHPVVNKLQTMVQSLVGRGVQVSNITSNQSPSSQLYGTFQEPSGQLGIKKGLLLTTGTVQNAIGPNNSPAKSGTEGLPGDPDLGNLVSDFTYDACVIEFDISTSSSQISFNYIFASEEYPEYVGSSFNDIFAFLISGPGITGTKNIALVPSTSTPVSINNVNEFSNPGYYHDNGSGLIVSTSGHIVQYDGYTLTLQAVAQVTPCETYHMKLAIADVGDDQLDSGVFIEAGSLSGSDGIRIAGVLAPDSLTVCPSAFPIQLQAGGASVPNYSWTKDEVEVLTGNQFYDVTDEGWYKVKAYIQPSCYWTDSIKITADTDFDLTISPDTGVCFGGSTMLEVSPTIGNAHYTYTWTPAAPLNNPAIANPIATLTSPTVFKVVVANNCFKDSADVAVSIFPPPIAQAYGDTTICYGGTAFLSAQNISPYQYSWTPAGSLSDPSVYNPIASPLSTTEYILTVNNKGCTKQDTVLVVVKEKVKAEILLPIRYGETPWKVKVRNVSSGASDYTWYITGFDSTKVFEPTLNVTEENYYTIVLKAINSLGCFDYDTIEIKAYKLFIPNLITPNGDGRNDSFQITGLGDNFTLEVYNRWGDRVYKKTDYRNEWNGEGLSDGVYFFMIYDAYKEKDYKGWVELLR